MSFLMQITVIIAVLLASIGIFTYFLAKFPLQKKIYLLFVSPLLLFAIGFILRLTTQQQLVDIGVFLTEYAYIFLWSVGVASFALGQLKYWKKR